LHRNPWRNQSRFGRLTINTSPTLTGGFLNLNGEKIGSKQKFTIIDLNGGDLMDGDPVKIRYTPGWSGRRGSNEEQLLVESADGIKRNSEGSVFKIRWWATSTHFKRRVASL